jgi:hypothetical protein
MHWSFIVVALDMTLTLESVILKIPWQSQKCDCLSLPVEENLEL